MSERYRCHECQENNPTGGHCISCDYGELIFAVGNKWPGETRHETALRYIRQAEQHTSGEAQCAAKAAALIETSKNHIKAKTDANI